MELTNCCRPLVPPTFGLCGQAEPGDTAICAWLLASGVGFQPGPQGRLPNYFVNFIRLQSPYFVSRPIARQAQPTWMLRRSCLGKCQPLSWTPARAGWAGVQRASNCSANQGQVTNVSALRNASLPPFSRR